jgi:hypothetical protein
VKSCVAFQPGAGEQEALVVDRADVDSPLAADGVQLVDEDDARGLPLGPLEEVANMGGADSHEHLYELAAAERKEGHLGLARHRQKSFLRSRFAAGIRLLPETSCVLLVDRGGGCVRGTAGRYAAAEQCDK